MLAASCHVRLPLASFSRKRRSGGRECRFGGRDRVDAAGKATLSAGDDGAVTGVEPVNEIEACALKADARALEVGGGRPEAARRRWHLGREGATTRPERVERSNDAIAQFRGATVEQPTQVAAIVQQLAGGVRRVEGGVGPSIGEDRPLLLLPTSRSSRYR